MQPDPKIDLLGAPLIKLGTCEFFIPVLTMRQNRIVVPALLQLLPKLQQIELLAKEGNSVSALALLDSEDYERLLNAVYGALTRAYPNLDKESFLDLPVGLGQLIDAIKVVIEQCGLFADTREEDSAPGEVPRAGTRSISISS